MTEQGDNFTLKEIEKIRRKYLTELMSKANVVGVATGFRQAGQILTDIPAMIVLVTKKLPAWQLEPGDVVPSQLDGIPVDVQEIGEIHLQQEGK